jgi:hypothetical protein
VATRACSFRKDDGEPCRAPPLRDSEFCIMHSPDHAEEVAEARRLGGLRRRREKTVAGAYEFEGLRSVEQIRRLLEIGVLDTLGLENSIARSRALAYMAQVSVRLLEVGELEERVQALESVLHPRLKEHAAQKAGGRRWRWRR